MKEELVENVAWIGHKSLRGPIRGVILSFAGLGGTASLKDWIGDQEREWASAGGLVVFPYYSPWAWMNPQTVAFVDELLDAVFLKYGLPPQTPIVATGGSMGGHGALAYTMNSRHRVARCYALSPVCDLLYHYGERPDLPRTFHAAYQSYDDIQEALIANSPARQTDRMPRIPYLVIHGDRDDAVAKSRHSDVFAARMRAAGHDFIYIELPGVGHCGPLSKATKQAISRFVREGWA
ncbi:MAG: alpha/beta hydrolase [Capsulimonas sp.]|nr:alpha/beta hydrolase [Capsulimonas sp.]